MPIPSRVEVLSWNENKVADLVREQKLLDCVDCIFQRHIDGQKLLNLKEGEVLHFLEIHNENSRRKLWNMFKKITEKKGDIHNLMSKFQQPNGRSYSDEPDAGEESFDDSFDSESDSDNYDLPEQEPPDQQAWSPQISVARKNTIKENLLAAMANSIKPPAVVSPDPRDFDSSGYPEPEDIYDTPEDGCDEPDDEMYEAPTDESGGGMVGHLPIKRQESEQYIVPNGNHGNSDDEEEYEVLGGRSSDPEESPEEYVVPDGGVPPRPPKPSEKQTPQKSPCHTPSSHKPPAQTPAPYKPPAQKPSSYKPPAKVPLSHISAVHKPPTTPKSVPNPPTPDLNPPDENYEAPEPPSKKVPNAKKPVQGGFKLPQPKNVKNTRVAEPELDENYEAPEPPSKKVPNAKKPVQGGFKLPQPKNVKNTRVAEPELDENYEAPEPPSKKVPNAKKPVQGGFKLPQPKNVKNTRVAEPELDENYEAPEPPSKKAPNAKKPVHGGFKLPQPKNVKNTRVAEPELVENYEAPEPPSKKVPNAKKSVLGGFKLPQPKNVKNTRVAEPELEQENYEAPAPPEKSSSKPVVQEEFEEEQEDYEIPSCTDKDIEEPQENYEIPSQEKPKPKPKLNFPKMFGKTNRSSPQSAAKLTSRIAKAIHKPDTSHNAQQAPPVPSTLPPIVPGPQKPAHAGSSNGPPSLPSRGSRAPMPGESTTKSDSPPTPLKPPAQRPLPCPEGSPSAARSNGTTSHRTPKKAGLPSKPLPKTNHQLLLEQPWFHGSVTKEFVSETLKKANRDGAYIVRNSSRSPGQYTMSLFYQSNIRHLEIPFEIGQYRLGKSGIVKFDSIIDLHEYYKKNDIEFSAGGRTRLAYPCAKKA